MWSAKTDSFSEGAQSSLLFDKIIGVEGENKEEMEGYEECRCPIVGIGIGLCCTCFEH